VKVACNGARNYIFEPVGDLLKVFSVRKPLNFNKYFTALGERCQLLSVSDFIWVVGQRSVEDIEFVHTLAESLFVDFALGKETEKLLY
jgi:hypothetical protein